MTQAPVSRPRPLDGHGNGKHAEPAPLVAVGLVGSPSTTREVTVDINEEASTRPLHGEIVSITHELWDRHLIALGTVTEIRTSNRWHEDPNMRGILKRHGKLPHLSEVGDVRTAEVLIQAAYAAARPAPPFGADPEEVGGSLSMSPTTGTAVHRIDDAFLSALLARHRKEIVFLGKVHQMEDVRLPLTIRDFGPREKGGAGEAYHTGVFGMTGSGKSVFAAYWLAAQLRHRSLGVLIMDPQGQFTTEEGLPFSLQQWAKAQGRAVETYSISNDLQLPKDAGLLADLLEGTRFFRDLLNFKTSDNRESAVAEFTRILRDTDGWETKSAETVMRDTLAALIDDDRAMTRIYASKSARDRVADMITNILGSPHGFAQAMEIFAPLHSLFTTRSARGGVRQPLGHVLARVLDPSVPVRPLVIIDFSAPPYSGASDAAGDLLETTEVKARILRRVCSELNRRAEMLFKQGRTLNTLVAFDEAQRFAAEAPENDEAQQLAERLVDYVRTTRKYGLGWMFITQEIGSLRRGIYAQLGVRCFGYGLTSGSELTRLQETIGDRAALDLYRAFVNPKAITPRRYPFMLSGPVSPLSFTGAPVFLSVYTDFADFQAGNGYDRRALTPNAPRGRMRPP